MAGHDVSIAFDHKDAGTPHNAAFYFADPMSHAVAMLLLRGVVTAPGATLSQVSACRPATTSSAATSTQP